MAEKTGWSLLVDYFQTCFVKCICVKVLLRDVWGILYLKWWEQLSKISVNKSNSCLIGRNQFCSWGQGLKYPIHHWPMFTQFQQHGCVNVEHEIASPSVRKNDILSLMLQEENLNEVLLVFQQKTSREVFRQLGSFTHTLVDIKIQD